MMEGLLFSTLFTTSMSLSPSVKAE
jgi:hypothetical protein